MPTLAQAVDRQRAVIVAVIAVAVVVAVGGAIIAYIRKRMLADQAPPGGLMLDDLRGLVREGKMTQAEFDNARNAITHAMADRDANKAGGSGISGKGR